MMRNLRKRKITELSDECMGRAEEADAVWLAPSCLQTGEANETLMPEPKTDEFSSDQQIEVEVRLAFSGVLVTRSKFRVNDSIGYMSSLGGLLCSTSHFFS